MRELPPYTGPRWEPRDIPPWIQAFLIALALTCIIALLMS